MTVLPRVMVLDYGSGNLRSAQRALERAGADVSVSGDIAAAGTVDGLVVPGVGAFAACMGGLEHTGGDVAIRSRVEGGRPVLGICVGMQVLFNSGEEHGVATKGLGVLPGAVRRLRAPRLPHMGWNTLTPASGSALFAEVSAGDRCYFVHSYAACDEETGLANIGAMLTYTEHGEQFVAGVEHGPISAVQFHPEKSGDVGAAILRGWLRGL